jgi:hypothetical protein
MEKKNYVWIHFTMGGKILRLKEVFFTKKEILVLTFNWYTLFTLMFRSHFREAARIKEYLDEYGLEELTKMARKVEKIPYSRVKQIRLSNRRRGMRPLIEIIMDKKREILRIHDKEFDYSSTKKDLEEILKNKKIEVIFD